MSSAASLLGGDLDVKGPREGLMSYPGPEHQVLTVDTGVLNEVHGRWV